jgi:hypothetical protein
LEIKLDVVLIASEHCVRFSIDTGIWPAKECKTTDDKLSKVESTFRSLAEKQARKQQGGELRSEDLSNAFEENIFKSFGVGDYLSYRLRDLKY